MKTITQMYKRLGVLMLLTMSFSVFGQNQKTYNATMSSGDVALEECRVYQVTDYGPNGHSIWLNGFPCAGVKTHFTFDNDANTGFLTRDGDGWRLQGTAFISDIRNAGSCDIPEGFMGSEWDVDVTFVTTDKELKGKKESGFNNIEDWTVDTVLETGKMTSKYGVVELLYMDNGYGLQFGPGANVKSEDFGTSTWFNFKFMLDGEQEYTQSQDHGDINANLTCAPGGDRPEPCEGYKAFYLDNAKGASTGDLYEVTFAGNDANFKFLTNVGFKGHVAYDAGARLIYVNNADGSEIKTYNEDGVEQGTGLPLVDAPSGIINSVFHDGQLYLGSDRTDKVYTVNLVTGALKEFSDVGGISGGDIAVLNGVFYSATRSGRKVRAFDASGVIANTNVQTERRVNGMAVSPGGDGFIMTNSGQNVVNVFDPVTGDAATPFMAMRDGVAFDLYNGDLASGCPSFPGGGDPDDCERYVAYYASHNGGDTSEIFGVTFDEGAKTATFDKITERKYEVHLAYNSDDRYIYAVNADNPELEQIDVNAGSGNFIDLVPATGETDTKLNAIYALVYNDGQLFMADAKANGIYEINFVGGVAEYSRIKGTYQVEGGDLVVKDSQLYLATRAGDQLFLISGGTATAVDNTIPKDVNGIALSEDNSFITTNFNSKVVFKLNDDGSVNDEYTVGGDITTLKNGDFASGCATGPDGDPFCSVGTFENPGAEVVVPEDFKNGFVQYSDLTVPANFGWSTTSSIEVQESGRINGVVSNNGEYHFELLSRAIGDNMYQAVATVPGTTVYLSFYHKKRPGQSDFDAMEVFAVGSSDDLNPMDISADANKIGESTVTTADDWKLVVVEYPVPAGQTETIFMLSGLSGSTKSVGNLIDDVAISCDDPTPATTSKEYTPTKSADPGLMVGFNNLRLFPVPAKSDLSIQVKDITKSAVGSYKIMSMTGRTTHKGLMNLNEGDNTITADVSNLPIGMYFVVMNVEGKQISKQFAKVSN